MTASRDESKGASPAPGSLTAEQRAALDVLTPKRRAFVLAYIGEARGGVIEAARLAGYAQPHPEGARLLRVATVQAAIEALRAPVERDAIASVDELRAFWTSVSRGDVKDGEAPAGLAVRLRASELLGKSAGMFIERRELSGPNGGPVQTDARILIATPEVARELAAEPPGRPLGDTER